MLRGSARPARPVPKSLEEHTVDRALHEAGFETCELTRLLTTNDQALDEFVEERDAVPLSRELVHTKHRVLIHASRVDDQSTAGGCQPCPYFTG